MCAKIIGTIGLLSDMVGAILVAIEIVKVFRGPITSGIRGTWNDMGEPTPEVDYNR